MELNKAFGSNEAMKSLLLPYLGTEYLEGNIRYLEGAMKIGAYVTEKDV